MSIETIFYSLGIVYLVVHLGILIALIIAVLALMQKMKEMKKNFEESWVGRLSQVKSGREAWPIMMDVWRMWRSKRGG